MVAVRKDRKMPSRMGLKIILVWGSINMPRLPALKKSPDNSPAFQGGSGVNQMKSPASTAEKQAGRADRELSQLAAGGMTRDGWNDFKAGWSGGALRIVTIRAPVPSAKSQPKAVYRPRFAKLVTLRKIRVPPRLSSLRFSSPSASLR